MMRVGRMKHYGDITKLHGELLEPVDIIIGGSPCQNLSIAGNRQGLSGEQSSLFLEQIRVVKESRKYHGKPRFMLWENVPGALTSNSGEDFRRVLEETVRIKEESVSIPRPANSKWSNAGCIMGDGFSVAWRIHDAQYWGVPQRRRRIALVADFDGQCAGEILFEPKGLRGDSTESGMPWEGTAGEAENCADTAVDGVKCLTPWDCQSKRVFDPDGAMSTYQAMGDGGANNVAVCYSFDALASNSMKSANSHSGCREVEVSKTLDTTDPNPSKNQGGIAIVQPTLRLNNQGGSVMSVSEDVAGTLRAQEHEHQPAICIQGNCIDRADTTGCNGKGWRDNDISFTLNTVDRPAVYDARGNGDGNTVPTLTGDHQNRVTDYTAVVCIGNGQADGLGEHDKVGALNCMHDQQIVLHETYQHHGYRTNDVSGTVTSGNSSVRGDTDLVVEQNLKFIIRRLTPLECERLQGFPEIIKADIENMSKDEFIALNLASGQIIADCKSGKVYTTKGPGGIALAKPKELAGTIVNGYRVVSIRNGAVKKQCRVHRVIWIAQNGVIPEGMVVDHINNDKLDNRIENLQLLTPEDNSSKASNDGLYLSGDENPASVISEQARIEIALWYQTGEFTIRQLAEKYGISKSRVHQIVKAYGWTDIGEWTDAKGKTHKASDTARYKALGNSIALPFWHWLLNRFAPYLPESPTMGSLFDGIGGFPLCWERIYGEGSAVWVSEIEPFCIAVTERRFNNIT